MRGIALRSKQEAEAVWSGAALALGLALVAVAAFDAMLWHPGFALGDEVDVIAFMQRSRESELFRWYLFNGSIHKVLLRTAMSLWPGKLWAPAVPALLGLGLEGCLLFVLARRWAGPRAGFFAVLAGMASAFTLVRARSALSLSLFPLEWLFLVWWRGFTRRPWHCALWGLCLGLCCFDYEGWLPGAALLLLLPIEGPLPASRRAWELCGFAAVFAVLLPKEELLRFIQRRTVASFKMPTAPSAGWRGVWELVAGGPSMPYMAPNGVGVLPPWQVLLLPIGLMAWGRRSLAPALTVIAGAAIVASGGAPYGLPAHRFIVAWPVMALLTGLALDWMLTRVDWRPLMALLAVAVIHQGWAWQRSARSTDGAYRVQSRDLQRAALAAKSLSRALGAPLVTETHPIKGPLFRYLLGEAVPLPESGARTAVAYVSWDYLPAIRGAQAEVTAFRESPLHAPEFVAVLKGRPAQGAIAMERSVRPLMAGTRQCWPESGERVRAWLDASKDADPWARTIAVDYRSLVILHNGRGFPKPWVLQLGAEPLISVRPLLVTSHAIRLFDPAQALRYAKMAHELDPNSGDASLLERQLLVEAGRQKEVAALDLEVQRTFDQGLLFTE